MTKKERDDRFAAELPRVLQYHQTMLADPVRNRLLHKAIRQNVGPDTSFLDIGAGSGVWAILAAKLGAKRVVAVEIEECLIPIIFKHAQENGVAGRIEIIHGHSNDVKLKGKFDVIVSELFGGDALGSATVEAFVNIRNRFLAPGGVLIPQKLTMLAAPAAFRSSDVPAGLLISSEYLSSLRRNYTRQLPVGERRQITFLAEPKSLVELDFRTCDAAPSLAGLTATWKVKDVAQANAIVMFNHSTFTERIVMDNFRSRSWGSTLYEFVPGGKGKGKVKFDITLDDKKTIWSMSFPDTAGASLQTFSPAFAAVRARMAQQMADYKRFKPKR